MKKNNLLFFIGLFIIVYFLIIPSKRHIKESNEYTLEDMEKEELKHGIHKDTVFLEFALGMDYSEASQKFSMLSSEKKITNIDTCQKNLCADYIVDDKNYSDSGKICCDFYDNKLSNMKIQFTEVTKKFSNELIEKFHSRYGDSLVISRNENGEEHHWIDGNRHIVVQISIPEKSLNIQYFDIESKYKKMSDEYIASSVFTKYLRETLLENSNSSVQL